jgi:Na+/H+ antiporter NhaD/arsenite permease-like protein
MQVAILVVFVVGYLMIAFEHPLKLNKTASALLTGVICWTIFMVTSPADNLLTSDTFQSFAQSLQSGEDKLLSSEDVYHDYVLHELGHHVIQISEILFFLLGAMTIVELIDAHHGFRFITDKIKTKSPRKLLWLVCWIAFFLSAILDNLTTTLVMVSLIRKLIPETKMRLLFAGMIIIAANAGGAWTPMGDVTTTMLWIGGQITTVNIIKVLLLPSVICLLVPLIFLTFRLKGSIHVSESATHKTNEEAVKGGKLMLTLGILILLGVPVFKVVTGLPPYIGMLLGLGIFWVVSEMIHPEMDQEIRKNYTAAGALSRIDTPSILFFLGILLAVGVLESMLMLRTFSEFLMAEIGDERIIISMIGVLSAIVDNVPLVAGAMGMYSLDVYPPDHFIWEYLAYCAGTGGSILVIGSAAGVAAMGLEKIDFIWYLKNISLLALLGYASGAIAYLLMHPM